jgi:putative transposase
VKTKRFTDEQITFALRQAEAGTPVSDVCRQLGVSEASFYLWRKKYAKLGLTEIRELRQLRDENTRLKRLVVDLTLDNTSWEKLSEKSSEAVTEAHAGPLDPSAVPGRRAPLVSAGGLFEVGLVQAQHRAGSVGAAAEDSRDRASETAVRISEDPRHVTPRGVAGEPEASLSLVST